MYLCAVVSELSSYDRCQSCVFLCIDTGVILIDDAIQANQCVDKQKLNKGCQVRDWIVGKLGFRISQILYSMHVNEG